MTAGAQRKPQAGFDIDRIIAAIRAALPADVAAAPLHQPCFVGNEWAYVKECLDTSYVSSVGGFVTRFEKQMAEAAGTAHAVAVVNGTAALHVCLLLAGVGQGDEVLAPALTFVATANAISYCGAIPHFVDSDPRTLGIDPRRLGDYLRRTTVRRGADLVNPRTGRRIKAIVAMHSFGHPVDMEPLLALGEEFGLFVIEDAAESLGSRYKGRATGSWSRLAAFSFNGNKIITTGGGGMIVTDDERLARRAKHLTTQARMPGPEYRHDEVGYNYRLTNLAAALGVAQLEQLPDFLAKKSAIAERYDSAWKRIAGITAPPRAPWASSSSWLYSVLLDPARFGCDRRALHERLLARGIQTRPIWSPLHTQPMYRDAPRLGGDVAESLFAQGLSLPCSVTLDPAAQQRVIDAIG
jgi:perosamine synthetase